MVRVLDCISNQKALPPEDTMADDGCVNLPSFGLSKYMDVTNPEAVSQLLSQIKNGQGAKKASQNLPGPSGLMASSNTKQGTSSDEETVTVPMETGAGGAEIRNVAQPYNFPFTAGSTQPIPGTSADTGPTTTVDTHLLKLIQNGEIVVKEDYKPAEPELELMTNEYSRFRYESERVCKNIKPRQYEMDEDRRFLAELKIKNYEGYATVIVYCVNERGYLHPFHLFGELCKDGVYVHQSQFGVRCPSLKLSKVIISTPKKKEYQKRLDASIKYLSTLGVLNDRVDTCNEPGDMQEVYLMVTVRLTTDNGPVTLSAQSTAIHNKKEGNEFKIYRVSPPSTTGSPSRYGGDSRRVMVVVTEKTAFPKSVGVVVRQRSKNQGVVWEATVKSPDKMTIIKKAVVECEMPPYPTKLTEPIEVELCLKDLKTNKETEPACFMYTPDDHDYGMAGKGKKRKLQDNLPPVWSQERHTSATKRTIKSVKRDTKMTSSTESYSDISSSSSNDNSLTNIQDVEQPTQQPPPTMIALSGQSNGQSSLRAELPFSSYTAGQVQQVKEEKSPSVCMKSSHGSSVSSSPYLSGSGSQDSFGSQQFTFPSNDATSSRNYGGGVASALVTSSQSVFTQSSTLANPIASTSTQASSTTFGNQTEQQQLLQQIQLHQSLANPVASTSSQVNNTTFGNQSEQQQMLQQLQQQIQQQLQMQQQQQQQQQEQQQQQQPQIPSNDLNSLLQDLFKQVPDNQPPPNEMVLPEKPPADDLPLEIPNLQPNQQLCIINGKMFILNDDIGIESNKPTVQNIAGQSVVVQHTDKQPQQPVSDLRQNEARDDVSLAAASSQSVAAAQNSHMIGEQNTQNSRTLGQQGASGNVTFTTASSLPANMTWTAGPNSQIPLTVTEPGQQYGTLTDPRVAMALQQQLQQHQAQNQQFGYNQSQWQQQPFSPSYNSCPQPRRLETNLDFDDDVEIDSCGDSSAKCVDTNEDNKVENKTNANANDKAEAKLEKSGDNEKGESVSDTGKVVVVRFDEHGNTRYEWHDADNIDLGMEVGSEVTISEDNEQVEEVLMSQVAVDNDSGHQTEDSRRD